MHVFADGFSTLSFSNNTLRVTLVQNGPNNTSIEVGTLIMPINQAVQFVNGLAGGIQKLDEQLKAGKEAQVQPQ